MYVCIYCIVLYCTTTRTNSKPRGLLGDFELIPPLRSVIILDDRDGTSGFETREPAGLDDTWEYVSHDLDEKDAKKVGKGDAPVSYAKAVAGVGVGIGAAGGMARPKSVRAA